MSDLVDQYRILYHIYKANHNGERITLSDLISEPDLVFMHKAGNLVPCLRRLKKTGYVENNDEDLQLTGNGLIATELIFRKFLTYIKKNYSDKLASWINILELHKNRSWDLILNAYFFIKNEPLMRNAFENYLEDLETLENLATFRVEPWGNISGGIRINLTSDYMRQMSWGQKATFWKRSQQQIKDVPLLEKINSIPGVSGVWFTDDKNSELFVVIKVNDPSEGENIAAKIRGYEGVGDVQVSLGPAGPPPPAPERTNENASV
jgi:hypothetical protein